ncbi:hypothetical protein [Facilibium subflavum]|uniref:hypothetical protein n=1 Tax=Facilibium subflavum TaxID=2219058 RepID=UPI000E64C4F3|nr:hypothetical protein [Facilibium subflavum]
MKEFTQLFQYSPTDKWAEIQFATEKKLYELGKIFGHELVTHTPDWQQMNQQKMDRWWLNIMHNHDWYAAKLGNDK